MILQPKHIDTRSMSEHLRARVIDVPARKLLISRLGGSAQEPDLTAPSNCNGFGRVRHFRQQTSVGWPVNPLPMVPACKALGIEAPPMMMAQVFQNAACAWRCWYCFVPYNLLSADPERSEWMTAKDLIQMYQSEQDQPLIIDLSGGSPDLVPEWTPWMMEALTAAGLDKTTYLWSDDNLSTTYLFDKLSLGDIEGVVGYRNYGRVCCFKGFDARSFTFNTRAAEIGFDLQFEIMRRMLELGLDLYGYVTFTAPDANEIDTSMRIFVDRLQVLDPNLPLRIVPLEILEFSPVSPRMDELRRQSLLVQQAAIVAWQRELERRFPTHVRSLRIADVPLHGRSPS